MAKSLAKQIVSGPQTQHNGLVLGGGGTNGHMNPPYPNLKHVVSTFLLFIPSFTDVIYIQVINQVHVPLKNKLLRRYFFLSLVRSKSLVAILHIEEAVHGRGL